MSTWLPFPLAGLGAKGGLPRGLQWDFISGCEPRGFAKSPSLGP